MKRYFSFLIFCLCAVLTFAQNINKGSFSVHLNDAQTNKFLYSDVDSITYSHFDTDGKYQDEIVTQEVWTKDKTYRFPVSTVDSITFVYLPDISGTWNCKEKHYNYAGNIRYDSYTVTLCEDGTVQTTATDSEILSSGWSLSEDGTVGIHIMDIATQTANSGVDWGGTIDNMENPTKITGYTNRWNFNTVGSFNGDSYEFEMTR